MNPPPAENTRRHFFTNAERLIWELSEGRNTVETSQRFGRQAPLWLRVTRASSVSKPMSGFSQKLDSSDAGLRDWSLKRRMGLEHANVIEILLGLFSLKGLSMHIQG